MTTLKKKSAIAFAWDMGGTLINQGSSFIISIFLARLLEPAEFGLVGMAMVFISISQVFIDVGFASALIQNKDNTKLTYSSVFYLNLAAGILLTTIFYFAAPLIGNFYENTNITELVRWLSLVFVFNSLNVVQAAILQRELNFKVLTIRSSVSAIAGGGVGVACAFSGLGVYSLVAQSLTGALLGTVLLWTTSNWKPDFKFSWKELKKLTGFSSYVFASSFFATIFQRLDILLIGKLFSPAILGFYTRAVSLKDMVTRYSSSSLTKVFYPVLSSVQDDTQEFHRIYLKVVSVITFLSFGITGVLYILGNDIILILFGGKWLPSVAIFQVLIIGACNHPINSMMVNAFMGKGKSKENFWIGMFRKSVRVIPFAIAYFYGLYEFTVAVVVVSYFLTIFNVFFLAKWVQLDVVSQLQKLFEAALPLAVVIFGFHFLEFSSLCSRVFYALGFSLSYLIYNWFIKNEGFLFIIDNIFSIRKKSLNKM